MSAERKDAAPRPEALPAGRGLDVLVAERVIGIVPVMVREKGGTARFPIYSDNPFWRGADGYYDRYTLTLRGDPPEFSRRISKAWQVVEKIQGFDTDRDEPWWSVALFYAQPGQVMCRIYACEPGALIDNTRTSIAVAIADTAPLAICRAALAAVERAS